ncbi:CpsD/CapB family tyrosine-protein kinase [Desulfosporosinus youngiae]|uniref:Capsular exopolysaccharide biosynthesis protein n=1 Tax=Desulfosporosinus youngiae DSM 17734 TaxID=768710 RepID=H5XUE4_9FIRM|nr:CpsD/CapB family tyrosine-protein kinase [Desulfosporosinus youngiae]EHQ89380.1 capsular exopolysaccharide biosynthesis protein [Desulfosporosinus youngiae DSM 17734]
MQMKLFNLYDHENQVVQEAYAMLTANIYVGNNKNMFKTFALTSCNPNEGKTSLAISLSITMAHLGWQVLLIDADMRKTAAKRLNEGSQLGLADYLEGKIELDQALSETNIPRFTYCACGNDHHNPVGLLCSVRFEELVSKVRNDYDIVLFDTPALASVGDGGIVASKVDATLLTVKMGLTTLTSLKRVKEQLEGLNANILGVVLNKVKKRDYKRYFGSYNYFFASKRFFNNKKVKNTNFPVDVHTSQM